MKKLYFLFFTFLITSLTFGQEVLLNGGFENWDDINTPTNWTHVESVEQESTEIHGGSFSAKHTGGTKDLGQTISGIIPGDIYHISIWYKVVENDGTDARIWSYWKDAADASLADNADELRGPNGSYLDNNGGVWTEYTVDVTAPATADKLYFEVRTYSGAVTYWDDFSVVHEASTEPTLALVDTPPSGSTLTLSPEDTSGTLEFVTTNFTVATPSTGDGYIKWSLKDGSDNIVDDGNVYDTSTTYPVTGMSPGNTYTFFAELVDNSGNPLSTPVNYTLTVIVKAYNTVANLAALRAGTEGEYYHVTGEIVGTFAQAYRNQKYAQDATAGILVDDNDGVITTVYNFGDGIMGLKGQLTSYNGILEIIPTVDPGAPSSTGNSVVPEVVTLSDIEGNLGAYESELVKINGVTFADGNGSNVFATGTNYNISDGTASVFRTAFFDADYIGELIPSGSQNIIVLVGGYNGTPQVTSRDLADLSGTLGLRKDEITGFNVFPNPVNNGKVYIYTQTNAEKQIMIYNILGKQVMMQTLKGRELNVSSLRSGVYIMKVMEDGKTATRKLIIN